MKIRLSVLLLLFLIFPLDAAGFGISSTFEAEKNFSWGASLDFQPDGLPFIFSGQALFCQKGVESLSGGIEFLAGNMHLYKALNFYYAPELALGYDFCRDRVILSNAIYAGLNGFFISRTEFFLQAGWVPQLLFSRRNADLNLLNFSVKAGLRLWTE